MEIVDAHHHLWDTGHLDYPLFRSNPILNRPFVLEDYERIAAKNRVSRSVCVEATSADSFAEVRWLLDQSKRSSVLTRLVLRAPVERPDHRDCLDRLLELDDERIVGVRRSFEFEPPDFPARDETIAGVKTLAEYGLSFDLVLYHSSLPAVLTLVRACPEVRFVLDHLGKPDIR